MINFMFSIIIIFYTYTLDFEFFCFGLMWVMFHLTKGLIAVTTDYIYSQFLKIFFFFFIRVSGLELIRYLFEFLF
nr:succinate dehydrogenase subunit 4 [Ceramothamnion sp.]